VNQRHAHKRFAFRNGESHIRDANSTAAPQLEQTFSQLIVLLLFCNSWLTPLSIRVNLRHIRNYQQYAEWLRTCMTTKSQIIFRQVALVTARLLFMPKLTAATGCQQPKDSTSRTIRTNWIQTMTESRPKKHLKSALFNHLALHHHQRHR